MFSVSQTCIVLAGGLGTRLRTVVSDLPKCLAPIGGQPFIAIQIAQLKRAGITDVVLSLGHMADKVVQALDGGGVGDGVRYVVEPEPLGTGGAIRYTLDKLGIGEALVANGDTYLDGDISSMLRPLDGNTGELFRMALVSVADRRRFGGVELDSAGYVRGFLEKGQSGPGPINAGLYRLCRAALADTPANAFSLEMYVLPKLIAKGNVSARILSGHFTDIGIPEDYRLFCEQYGTT